MEDEQNKLPAGSLAQSGEVKRWDAAVLAATLACVSLEERLGYAEDHDDRAVVLFRKGREAMKQGDYPLACSELEQSELLEASPGTALNLAVCEERMGHLVRARAFIGLFLSSARANDARRESAVQLATDLDSRMSRLAVQVEPSTVPGSRVTVDDHEVALPTAEPFAVDPGLHTVHVVVPGYVEQRVTTKLEEGQLVWNRFTMTPSVTTTPSRRATSPHSLHAPLPPLFYGALGVGVAGTLTAVASGVLVAAAHTKVEEHCVNKLCDPEGLAAVRRGRAFATVNTIAWPFALAGASLAAYLLLTRSPRASGQVALGISVSAAQASLTLQGDVP